MNRDPDLDDLADAIVEAQADRPSWLARLARRALIKAAPFALFSIAAGVLLARTGVDVGSLLMPMVWAGPFVVVAVASFVAHAWRQNSTTRVYGVGQEVGQAEPGQVADQVGQAGQPAQAVEVGQVARVAKPAPLATVTVTVLPTPVAELTQSPTRPGQGDTVYPTVPEEEIA